MKRINVFFLCFFLLFLFTSCCCFQRSNVFVLLPDPDGQTGKILVSNPAGSQLLVEPRQATEITKAGEAPSAPFIMQEKQIRDLFGPALEVQPLDSPPTYSIKDISIEEKQLRELSRPIGDDGQPLPAIRFLLYFKTGSTELTEDSLKLFLVVLKTIQARNPTEVSIVGHTDRVGTRESNFKTGLNRADFIKNRLIALGLDPKMIEVASHGEDNPLVKTEDEVPEPRNRRIEITIR